MTFKASQLFLVLNALKDLGDNRLPFPTAVRLKRILRQLGDYLEAFNEDIRPYLEEYGDVESGIVPGENIEDFVEAAEEQLNTEIKIENLEPFTMEQLESIAEGRTLDVRPETLEVLESLGMLEV